MRCNIDGTGEINQSCSSGCNADQKLCNATYRDSNILFRHDGGEVLVWLLNHPNKGSYVSAPSLGPQNPAWTVRGTGDFNDDGHGDILFQHSSGRTQIWIVQDGRKDREVAGADPGLEWAIEGVGNFDAKDGADVLWRKGGQLAISFGGTGWSEVAAPIEPGWEVKATGDFDGDAHSDIVWRHGDGRVAIWFMNGTRQLGVSYPGGKGPGASWNIQGAGDFDADSRDDILWRNDRGVFAMWLGGDQPVEGPWLRNDRNMVIDLSFSVEAIGDFNHDKRADFLWRGKASDRRTVLWFLNGATFLEDPELPIAQPEWQIKGLLRD